jgi:hypothetical protein
MARNSLYLHGEQADVAALRRELFAPCGALRGLGLEIRIVDDRVGLWWAEWESCVHIPDDSICTFSRRHPDIVIRYARWGGGGDGMVEYCSGRPTQS